ncbi:MAG: Iron transporter [Nevskia sp.]|nr:Iron transporter [Nevskia sp.]
MRSKHAGRPNTAMRQRSATVAGRHLIRLGAVLAGLWLGSAMAADAPTTELGPITVTSTRTAQPAFDVPASVDVIDGSEFNQDTLGVNLSEGLPAVAGVLSRDRQNYAQDEQLSIRGFGARSTFGVRGVRLYVDDIPATQPDGQGQVSHFNLASADRVEVLRGPFSALYGNSSGGVIQIFTADGHAPPQISAGAAGGSYGTWRTNIGANGIANLGAQAFDYNADYTHFHTDGFRDHSRAQRDSFNGKVGLDFKQYGHLTLLLNYFSNPEAQDPLGLTRVQFDAKPSQSASVATQFNTRKSVEQMQGGAVYEYALSDTQTLRVLGYYGNRQIRQFLSIPQSAQSSVFHSGGVVDLGSDYGGTDARWTYRSLLAGAPFNLVAGLSYDDLSQHRRGYENFVTDGMGNTTLGVQGNERRDEINTVYDLDEYLQGSWQPGEHWSLMAGVRHSQIKFDSKDHYQNGLNGDDSGRAGYYATTPVGGVLYKLNPALHLYAAYGEGVETPTLNELAYRPDGASGLNFALQAARTNNAEVGAKWRLREHTQAGVALFQGITRHELVVATNSGGRSTYQNVDRTRRQGVEASLDTEFADNWHLQLAYTYVDATIRTRYLTCVTTGCTVLNTPVLAGNRIPGVAESDLYSALRWGGERGWHAEVNARYLSDVPANDTNSSTAPSYALLGVNGGYAFDLEHWRIRTFVQLDNLLDEDYIGSVIVNDGNGRFYEPGPGRSVLAGASFDWKY